MKVATTSPRTNSGAIELRPIVERVLEWSSINSGTRNLTGLAVLADRLLEAFSALPGEVTLINASTVQNVDAGGELVTVRSGRHLVARIRPEAARRVLLTGHMDTVYGPEDPFQEAEWLDERRLRGPGVLDMKSGLAIMLEGLLAFEVSRPELGYDVLINSDEETGSASSAALIAELAQDKVAALTFEPTLPGGALARARPGSGNYAARVAGRAAHAGRNPQDGRNAVVAAADLALRLAQARRPGLAINPARIDGGGPNNVVPSLAVLRFNVRPSGAADAAEATTLVNRLAAEVEAAHEVGIDLHGGMGRPAKPVGADAERLFALVSSSAAELGDTLEWRDSGGVCDGNNIAGAGVPVIDTMGACGDFIHSPQEYVDTASMVPKVHLAARVLQRIDHGEFA